MASLASTDHSAPARLPAEAVRLSMSRVILAWAFGAIFFNISAGAIYTSFARQIGVTESQFGFLAGAYPLMSFLQIPAARLLEVSVRPRRMMLFCGLIGRGLWVVAAALPLAVRYAPDLLPHRLLVPAFIGCVTVSGIFQAFTGPSFFTWMSSLVPGRVNAAFWARRQQVGMIVAIAATLIGGAIADQAVAVKAATNDAIPPLMLYAVLLIIASICGVLDIAIFWQVKEPAHLRQFKSRDQLPGFFSSLAAPLRERQVRRYLLFASLAVSSGACMQPLLWLLCLEQFGWSRTQSGIILTIAPQVAMVFSAMFWGETVRTYGMRPNARFLALGFLFTPIPWLFATPDSWWPMLALVGFSGAMAAGFDICNTQFMTRACPHLSRPTMVAVLGITAGTATALAAWLAGVAAECMDGVHFEIAGHTLINYHVVFLVSLLIRGVNAFFVAPRLEEPEATPTREAVRDAASTLYEAFAARFARLTGAREE